MRRLPFADASFDAVLNLFNAFGYLEDDAQDELVLHEVARVLRPGGRYQRGSGSPRDRVIGRFDELAAADGRTPRVVGASHRQVLDHLGAMGGQIEELEPVAWEEQETYAEALAWVSERVFSYHWRLPDEVWRAAAAQVRAEIHAEHPDLDTPRPARHSFQFVVARFPAAGGREHGGSREAGRGTGLAVGDPP